MSPGRIETSTGESPRVRKTDVSCRWWRLCDYFISGYGHVDTFEGFKLLGFIVTMILSFQLSSLRVLVLDKDA